jgi:RNA polymerase sigma-54 factor
MALHMRQDIRMSQQLVMTPQLQQAIKLLQLSRMELVDMVHEEMLENPILEDDFEVSAEQNKERELLGGDDQVNLQLERAGNTETPLEAQAVENPNQVEVKADGTAVNEIDWENYLDNYSMASPMPAYRGDSEDLPSLEATLTRPPSLHDHLAWQLKLSDLTDREKEIGLTIIGNIDADGYFKEPSVAELAADEGLSEEEVEKVLEKIQSFDPTGVGARNLAECGITPDVYVYKMGDEYTVVLNDDGLSKLRISGAYAQALRGGRLPSGQTKEFVQEKLRSAMWLIRSIHQRQRTITR